MARVSARGKGLWLRLGLLGGSLAGTSAGLALQYRDFSLYTRAMSQHGIPTSRLQYGDLTLYTRALSQHGATSRLRAEIVGMVL